MNGTPVVPMVSALTVARLHNLGNYEHVRYEVTVAMPDGASPAAVLADVSAILADLKPARHHAATVEGAREIVRNGEPPVATPADEYEVRRARERWEAAGRLIKEADAEQRRIDRAAQALDNLGGARRYTDAKLEWDDEDY